MSEQRVEGREGSAGAKGDVIFVHSRVALDATGQNGFYDEEGSRCFASPETVPRFDWFPKVRPVL